MWISILDLNNFQKLCYSFPLSSLLVEECYWMLLISFVRSGWMQFVLLTSTKSSPITFPRARICYAICNHEKCGECFSCFYLTWIWNFSGYWNCFWPVKFDHGFKIAKGLDVDDMMVQMHFPQFLHQLSQGENLVFHWSAGVKPVWYTDVFEVHGTIRLARQVINASSFIYGKNNANH